MHNCEDLSHPLWHLSSGDVVPYSFRPPVLSGLSQYPWTQNLVPHQSWLMQASHSFAPARRAMCGCIYLVISFSYSAVNQAITIPSPLSQTKARIRTKNMYSGTFLMVQWLRVGASTTRGHRFNPWFVIQIPCVSAHGQNNKSATKYWMTWIYSMTFLPTPCPSQVQTSLKILFRVFFISKKLCCTDRHS